MVFAVKIKGNWYIAKKVKGSSHHHYLGDGDVWVEVPSTAFLGYVEQAEAVVDLDGK